MERIGIAASKIAQGNLFLYNFFVVAIASLFSLLVFFVSGCAIVLMLVIVAYVSSPGGFPDLQKGWMPAMVVCMVCLAIVVAVFNLCAVFKNIKLKKN